MIYYDNNTPCHILISLISTKIFAHDLAIINGKSSMETGDPLAY